MINLSINNVSKTKQSQLTTAILAAVESSTPLEQFAILTALRNATEDALDVARQRVYIEQDLSPDTPVSVAEGKNFTHNGLVFRILTKCDYNYEANDDLPAAEGYTLRELIQMKKNLDVQTEQRTKDIKLRKQKILQAHPKMLPIAGSVRYTISFQGTKEEAKD